MRNFGDVLDHDYKVIVYSSYYTKKLAASPPGTPKHEVYKKYVERQPLMKGREAVNVAKGRIYQSSDSSLSDLSPNLGRIPFILTKFNSISDNLFPNQTQIQIQI